MNFRYNMCKYKEGMETHSSILAWRIPMTEEPGGLQSMESQRVEPDCRDLAHMCMGKYVF